MCASKITIDHDVIRHWAEMRGGRPAAVKGVEFGQPEASALRIEIPSATEGELVFISWDEFFRKFDDARLALVYQGQTDHGEAGRFSRLISRPEGILETLRVEHEQILASLAEMLETSTRAKRSRDDLMRQLKALLPPHLRAEEKLFYPRLRRKGYQDDDVLEAFEGHWAVQQAFSRLEKTDAGDELWHARAKMLKDLVEHHVETEQNVLFDLARELMDSRDLHELDERYAESEHQKTRVRV
jgi:hemerythrin-like domain-containing protein